MTDHIYPETSDYWIQASFQKFLWFRRFHQGRWDPAQDETSKRFWFQEYWDETSGNWSNQTINLWLIKFIQRPASTGSKRRSRKSSVSYGYIKEMGLLQKIVDKMLFCMGRNSRIGVFLSIAVTAEVVAILSLVSTIMLLFWAGFHLQAGILLLMSVSTNIVGVRNIYL